MKDLSLRIAAGQASSWERRWWDECKRRAPEREAHQARVRQQQREAMEAREQLRECAAVADCLVFAEEWLASYGMDSVDASDLREAVQRAVTAEFVYDAYPSLPRVDSELTDLLTEAELELRRFAQNKIEAAGWRYDPDQDLQTLCMTVSQSAAAELCS